MLNRKLYSVVNLSIFGAAMLTVSACTDHDWEGPHANSDRITYKLIADNAYPRSRTNDLAGGCILSLVDQSGSDSLYLHQNIGNMPTPTTKATTSSRGTPVSTANFQEVVGSFSVQAYTTGGQLYIANSQVGNYDSEQSVWIETNGAHYWSDEALDFYAIAPYNTVDVDYNTTDKTMSFDYKVPVDPTPTDDVGQQDAEYQPDIMMAFTGDVTKDETINKSGTVTTKFWHALAGVRFEATDIAGGTVKSITLRNLYGEGSAVFHSQRIPGYESEDDVNDNTQDNATDKIPFEWVVKGDANCSYTQMFNVPVEEGSTSTSNTPQKVTDVNPATTFMLMPQKLPENAEIVVVLDTKEDGEKTLIGKIYNYIISTNSINWTYVFEVTPWTNRTEPSEDEKPGEHDVYYDTAKDTLFHGLRVTHFSYTVVSYRYRTNDPSQVELLPWEATPTDATTSIDWREKGLAFNDWMPNLTRAYGLSGQGNTEQDTVRYKSFMHFVTLVTDCPGDKFLYEAEPVGTKESPRDLSFYDVSGSPSSTQNTANCYIVRGSGYYMIPLIYGNTMKNGVYNLYSVKYDYNGDATKTSWPHTEAMKDFDRHDGDNIMDPWIQNNVNIDNATGILLWSDAYNLVTEVKKISVNGMGYLSFYVNRDDIQQGNAVIGLRDTTGDIMWSWHIWVTEQNLLNTIPLGNINADNKNSTGYRLAPSSLGWCDSKKEWYTGRHGHIKFVQSINPNPSGTIKLNIKQLTAVYESTYGNQLYYQFGRKDPFIGVMNHGNLTKHLFYDTKEITSGGEYEYITSDKKYGSSNARAFVKDGITNPNVLYVGIVEKSDWGGDWHRHSSSAYTAWQPYTNLWNNKSLPESGIKIYSRRSVVVKTVYDPSPIGFVVPPKDAFRILSTVTDHTGGTFSKLVGGSYDDYTYTCYGKPNKDEASKIVFHATGVRWYAKKFTGIGKPGDNWSNECVYLWTSDYCNFEQKTDPDGKRVGTHEWAYSLYLVAPGIDEDYTSGRCDPTFQGATGMARPVRPIKDEYSYSKL